MLFKDAQPVLGARAFPSSTLPPSRSRLMAQPRRIMGSGWGSTEGPSQALRHPPHPAPREAVQPSFLLSLSPRDAS